MWFLLFIVVFIIVYIKSFKENFTAETIEKVTPALFIVTTLVLALSIISSIVG